MDLDEAGMDIAGGLLDVGMDIWLGPIGMMRNIIRFITADDNDSRKAHAKCETAPSAYKNNWSQATLPASHVRPTSVRANVYHPRVRPSVVIPPTVRRSFRRAE